MRRIALINQKGGAGKTTTVANLGACLASLGKKVLTVDLDPQANLSIHLGIKINELKHSVYDLLFWRTRPERVILPTPVEGLHIIPSNINLSRAEIELVNMPSRKTILKDRLFLTFKKYDYILIDCAPSLGLLTLNALIAVQEIFIPIQTQFFALQGINRLLETVEIIRKKVNPLLKITGVIPVMYDTRTNLSHEVLEKIREYFKKEVFKAVIRDNVRLAESPSFGLPITLYSPNSYGAEDYMKLAREVLSRDQK